MTDSTVPEILALAADLIERTSYERGFSAGPDTWGTLSLAAHQLAIDPAATAICRHAGITRINELGDATRNQVVATMRTAAGGAGPDTGLREDSALRQVDDARLALLDALGAGDAGSPKHLSQVVQSAAEKIREQALEIDKLARDLADADRVRTRLLEQMREDAAQIVELDQEIEGFGDEESEVAADIRALPVR